jgi:hypothetical protein
VNGGRILVDQLVAEGVDRAFGVPGESYLAVLDALYDTPEITYHLCRQEGGAAMGRLGVVHRYDRRHRSGALGDSVRHDDGLQARTGRLGLGARAVLGRPLSRAFSAHAERGRPPRHVVVRASAAYYI